MLIFGPRGCRWGPIQGLTLPPWLALSLGWVPAVGLATWPGLLKGWSGDTKSHPCRFRAASGISLHGCGVNVS